MFKNLTSFNFVSDYFQFNVMVISFLFLVLLFTAVTFKMPFLSMSKVTSNFSSPAFAGSSPLGRFVSISSVDRIKSVRYFCRSYTVTALYTAQMPGSMPEGLHNYQIMFIV